MGISGEGAKMLIVEDNSDYRAQLKDVLCSRFPTASVDEAGDAAEALGKIREGPPRVVIMDIRLPGENGLILTRKVKESHPEIQIIVLTNHDLPAYQEAARRYGARDFLSKGSATEEDIVRSVEAALSEIT
jgi:DNA-binding NarL/FixJ family response regulator